MKTTLLFLALLLVSYSVTAQEQPPSFGPIKLGQKKTEQEKEFNKMKGVKFLRYDTTAAGVIATYTGGKFLGERVEQWFVSYDSSETVERGLIDFVEPSWKSAATSFERLWNQMDKKYIFLGGIRLSEFRREQGVTMNQIHDMLIEKAANDEDNVFFGTWFSDTEEPMLAKMELDHQYLWIKITSISDAANE